MMNRKKLLTNSIISFFIIAVMLNTTMTYLLTSWIREDRKVITQVQRGILESEKEIQNLKNKIEFETNVRQELFPKLQKSAHLLSKYNPRLDYSTALQYAFRIYECSGEEVNLEVLTILICVESSANHRAISKKGALGLTQVMPSIWGYNKETLFNPYKNIEIGSRILKDYVERHGLLGGLSAYNSGRKNFSIRYARNILNMANRHFVK
jgi:hypothetical protein